MAHLLKALVRQDVRPFTILVVVVIVLGVMDRGTGFFFSLPTAFSVMQLFATFGLVALGVGLSLLVREFDISVAGMVSLAGTIAVLTGISDPRLGLAAGVAAGLARGRISGADHDQSSPQFGGGHVGRPPDLSGYYLRTHRRPVDRLSQYACGAAAQRAHLGPAVGSQRGCTGCFVIAAVIMGYTSIGRDVYATGNDRRASAVAGVKTNRVIIGVFAASGGLSALTGVLLSYGLAAASPEGLADMLAPAAAAAIIGGVSLVGGRGHPMGIAAGVLILGILHSGLNAVGVTPHVHDIVTGAILFAVAIIDAPDFTRRLMTWRLHWKERTVAAIGVGVQAPK